MSDEANAPSNGASDTVQPDVGQPVPQPTPQVTEPERSKTTREALDKAFAKFDEPAKPVEAAKPAADRARDPATGQFAPKDKAADAKPAEPKPTDAKPAEPKPDAAKDQPKAPPVPAPQHLGLSKPAAEAWGQAPEVLRADIERRHGELVQGIEKYKTAYEPLRRYDDMAKRSGTTLETALEHYTSIDSVMQQNPIAGVVQVCRVMGLDPRAVAAAIVNLQELPQPPAPRPAQQQQPAADDRYTALESRLNQVVAQSIIDKFAVTHPRFAELEADISEMIGSGYAKSLEDAYDKATRLRPEAAAKVEPPSKPKEPDPDQTREKANLSVTGSPSPGSHPAAKKPAGSAREAVNNAFARVGL